MSAWSSFIASRSRLAHWRLGEANATGGAVDASGNSRTLTYRTSSITYGVTGSAAGDADTAVTVAGLSAGATSYIAHAASGSYLNGLGLLTLVAAVKMPSGSSTGFLLNSFDAAAAANGRCFIDVATGKARCNFYTTGAVQHAITGATSVNDNAYHLIIAVFNGTTGAVDLYIGNTDGSVIHDGTRTDSGTPLTIQTPGTDRGVTVGGRPNGASFDAENTFTEDEAVILNEAWSADVVSEAVHAWANIAFPGTASPTVTLSVVAAGQLGLIGTATKTVTLSAVAAGRLGLFGAATPTVSLGAVAAGTVQAAGTGSATPTVSLGVATAGVVGRSTGATPIVTLSVNAAGRLGLFGGATKALSVGVVAAGTVGADLTSGATKTVSISAVAAGVVLTGPGALPVIHIGVVAAGVVQVPAETQLIFGTGGRNRDGTCDVEWEGEPDPPPWSVTEAIRRISAHAIDSFTVTGPRRNDVQVEFRTRSADEPDYEIKVGGRDITNWRGMRTPQPSWQLVSPGRYGPGSLTIPQIKAGMETPGEGALWWLKEFAQVQHRVRGHDGNWKIVYKGWISDEDESGPDYTVTLLGELTGVAGMQQRTPRVNLPRVRDLAVLVVECIRHLPRRLNASAPADGTGVIMVDSGGSQTQWDWLSQTMAASTSRGGKQWTFMPDSNGVYQLTRKNQETVHYTLYVDDAHVKASLRRDYTEEDNVIYGDAVRQDGMRITGLVIPGMASESGRAAYPMSGTTPMPPGTTDADTATGFGVSSLQSRLIVLGVLDDDDGLSGVIEDETTRAIRRAQLIADLDEHGDTVLGTVDVRTWHAIFDGDATGWSMRKAYIMPLAQDTRTRKFRLNSSGQRIGLNPRYNPHVMPRERYVSMGQVKNAGQARDWAQQTLDDGSPDYVGTIDLPLGALIAGEHSPGDPFHASMLRDARLVTPNENVKLANHRAGLCHISGVALTDGDVQLTVDTRARDTEPIWAVLDRLRSARVNRGRVWRRNNLSSTQTRDVGAVWDAFGGIVDDYWHIPGHTWVIIPVRAGREGTIMRLRVQLRDARPEFCWAMFCRSITDDTLTHLIGNPLTDDGRRNWRRKSETLTEDHFMIYAAGTDTNPLGYHPTTKPNASADFPDKTVDEVRTGDHRDDGGFSYRAFGAPVIWNAFYADRDTVLQPGRLFRVQLSDQV